MRLASDKDLQYEGVERKGMTLVSTRPANAGTVPASVEADRMVTYTTASRAVPTRWDTAIDVVRDGIRNALRFVGYGGSGLVLVYVVWLGLTTLLQAWGAR